MEQFPLNLSRRCRAALWELAIILNIQLLYVISVICYIYMIINFNNKFNIYTNNVILGAQNIQVQIRLVGEVAWGDRSYLQLFNIIIRRCLQYMKFSLLGRNYFDPNLKATLHEHNLEIWPGFLTAMCQYESNIMLNVDLSFKVNFNKL